MSAESSRWRESIDTVLRYVSGSLAVRTGRYGASQAGTRWYVTSGSSLKSGRRAPSRTNLSQSKMCLDRLTSLDAVVRGTDRDKADHRSSTEYNRGRTRQRV